MKTLFTKNISLEVQGLVLVTLTNPKYTVTGTLNSDVYFHKVLP